jgi:hypothetical protein
MDCTREGGIELAKNKANNANGMVEIRNLREGPRSYQLDDGSSLLLPGKHRGAVYPEIPNGKVNDILRDAEKRGLIEIVEKEGGDPVGTGNAEGDLDRS